MKCPICKREKADEEFIDAIYENELVQICKVCASIENLPVVKKPTAEQIKRGDQRYTVRETMMRISGMNKLRTLGPDSPVAIKHLGKIKFPEKAQEPLDLVENYNWALRIARRRKKESLSQISKLINVPEAVLKEIEDGKLPKNYQQIIPLMETALGVVVRKKAGAKLNFVKPGNIPMDKSGEEQKQKTEALSKIKQGDFNFSDKKKVENLTLEDLRKLKEEKAAREDSEDIESLSIDDFDEEF